MKKRHTRAAPTLFSGYAYGTAEEREETVAALFARAVSARSAVEQEWQRYNDYYNFCHDVTGEAGERFRENDLPFAPAAVPDPWIIVESQVDPNVPQPQFHGRDGDMDSQKARKREYAVRYICENNRLSDMNTRNERRLLKYGDAFWKAYWDADMRCGIHEGDIRIRDVPVDAIFPDPAVRDGELQDGQYLCYVYRLHKVLFARRFARDLERLGVSADELSGAGAAAPLFDMTTALDESDDTVEVLEHWFRQPADTTVNGEFVPAGSVACSIQAGGRELRYIPSYWKRTQRQCQLFPFVHYWRVQDENRFWNKSELFPIMDMVDAADRKLAVGMLGDALMANDVILAEEGALSDGEEISNEPGAVIRVKPNRINAVRRLGGVQSLANAAVTLGWYKEEIERTTRNYEIGRGKEASRIDTASALAMLRSDAEGQNDIKKADRNRGFERLYELLDWLALEFFDDDRLIYLGADPAEGREPVFFRYNSDAFAERVPEVLDEQGVIVREPWMSWPRVDVTISAGEGLIQSKKATLETLQLLAQSEITAENWKLYAAQLEILNIPGKQEIIEDWRSRFTAPAVPHEEGETL